MAHSVPLTFLGVSWRVGDGYGDQVGMQVLHSQKILPSNQNPVVGTNVYVKSPNLLCFSTFVR